MSPKQELALENIVRAGDVEGCLAFFTDMPEKERRKLAPHARQLLREPESEWDSYAPCERVAVLATASLTEIRRYRDKVLPGLLEDYSDAEYRALENRRPAWLQSWCKWTLDRGYSVWHLVRALVRDGVCPPPDTDMYVLGMIRNLTGSTRLESLRNDPKLLDDEIWRLFEIEGNSHATLSRDGKYNWRDEKEWAHALRELSNEGRIDRNRLLNASLAALNRDFTPYHARLYSDFHEYMQPTVEERAARTDKYLDLLTSPTLPIVSFAMRALVTIHKARQLDNAAFVARAEPVLYATTKTPPMQVLKIFADIANEDSGLADQTVELAMVGLEHAQSDVQALALDIIEHHGDRGDEGLRAAIEERAPLMAATTRARAQKWFPALISAPEHAEPDDLDELRKCVRALPPDLAERNGVAIAMAELESLTGMIPAINNGHLAQFAPHVRTRFRPNFRSLLIWLFFWPIIIFFRLTMPRHQSGMFAPPDAEITLEYVLRSMDGPYLKSLRHDILSSARVRFLFEMLLRLEGEKYLYQGVPAGWEFLEDTDKPLTDKAVLRMAHELGGPYASGRQYEADVLICIVEDGRLDHRQLGEEMEILLAIGLIKPSRWAEALAIVAAETPLHAQVVRNALERALSVGPDPRLHNIHMLLELLLNLCIEAEEVITDAGCRTFLESFSGNSKAAKLARRLLALEPGDPRPHRRAAAIVALHGRLARAERWAGVQATPESR